MGLLKDLSGTSAEGLGQERWQNGGLTMGWVSLVPAILSCFRSSEAALEQPRRPACLEALKDPGRALVLASGIFLPQTNAENPRSGISELPVACCRVRDNSKVCVPVDRRFPQPFLSLEQ